MTEQNKNFKTAIVTAKISATSNSVNEAFKNDNPTKTVYLEDLSSDDITKLEALGLQQYTAKDGAKFFAVKASKTVKVFHSDETYTPLDFSVSLPNLYTDQPIKMAITWVKNDKKGYNDFVRLNALQLDDLTIIKQVEMTNPFK